MKFIFLLKCNPKIWSVGSAVLKFIQQVFLESLYHSVCPESFLCVCVWWEA